MQHQIASLDLNTDSTMGVDKISHDNAIYSEVDEAIQDFTMNQNNCYESKNQLSHTRCYDKKKYNSRKIVTALIMLSMTAFLLGTVSACIAFSLEISKVSDIVHKLNTSVSVLEIRTLQVVTALSTGEDPSFPTISCAALPSSMPSDYYWISASNGSAVRVYCDMTRSCGGVTGGWMQVAELDMTNSSNQCPSDLQLRTGSNLRTCVRRQESAGCTSLNNFASSVVPYSKVCGRIIGYQSFSTDAFYNPKNINTAYVDGVSLTHGSPRQHIWTFAAAHDLHDNRANCPCINPPLPTESGALPPSFVENDYFCATGTNDFNHNVFYSGNPLWDGIGCRPPNTCCSFNSPPWFYKQLPQPTMDDIEVRVCRDEVRSDEDIAIEIIDLYVQ